MTSSPQKLSDNSLSGDIEYPNNPWTARLYWEVQNYMIYDAYSAYYNARAIIPDQRNTQQRIAASNYEGKSRLRLRFADTTHIYPLMDIYYVLPGLNIETTKIADFQL